MNSLFQQLRGPVQSLQAQLPQNQKLPLSETQISNLKNLLNFQNPQSLIQSMIQNNPKLNNIFQLFKSSGMSPKQFFYNYAQQNGIDPNQLINTLQQK